MSLGFCTAALPRYCASERLSARQVATTAQQYQQAQQQPRSLATRKTKDAGLCNTIWRVAGLSSA